METKLIPVYNGNDIEIIENRNWFAKLYYLSTGKTIRPMFGYTN